MYNEYFGFAESPFALTPDPRFFFVNAVYEEAFSTLRYGIDARKGFIVVVGEAGTGKTTLLKRLVQNLEPDVHTACIFDPHLSFEELLRCTLSDFGLTSVDEDRFTMIKRLYDYLIRQLENDQIVTLIIDEAQNLNGELLEELRLLSNLETDSQKLLQIVLLGQPEFEARLAETQWLALKQRVALHCRLKRLERHEIGRYIDARLETQHCKSRDLFDAESVDRIALYSKGIPRVINVICDNALLNACATSRRRVSALEIDTAAQELKLLDQPQFDAQTPAGDLRMGTRNRTERDHLPQGSRGPNDNHRIRPEFEFSFTDTGNRPLGEKRAASSRSMRIGMLLIFLLTFGAGWFSTAQQRQFFIDEARRYFENLILFGREAEWFRLTHPPKIQTQTTVAYDSQSLASPPPPPSTQRWDGPIARSPAPTGRDETANIDKDARVHPPGKRPIELTKQNSLTIKRVPSARLPGNAPDRKRQLEFAIGKAIQDRAINGIEVSVSDDTVYLDGRVATPQQVLSAVRATLTVPGVKHIRNRVVVSG